MINITNVVSEFNQPDFEAVVQTYNLGDLQFKSFFPSKYTTQLTFKSLQSTAGAKVAADIVAFDSRSPIKGRQMPNSIMGDIPKVNMKKVKTESDINVYKQLQAAATRSQNPQAVTALIDWIYGDATAALDGVNARIEWMAKQAISGGKYILDPGNNPAGVATKVGVDFQIPSANIVSASSAWTVANAATNDPIKDIKERVKYARGKGFKVNFITMDNDTFNNMTASVAVQKFAAGYVSVALGLQSQPTLQSVNVALVSAGLPPIRVWDSYVNIEGKDGVLSSTTGWVAGNVVLTVSSTFGDVQWTDTADSQVNIDASTKAYNDFSLVKTYAEQDPINMITQGIAYAIPVLQNSNQVFIIKTA